MNKTKKLIEIIDHAYTYAPTFTKIMNGAGLTPADIQSVIDLPKIPVTSKDELANQQQQNPPFGGWLAVPVNTLRRIFISPGPIFDPQGDEMDGQKTAAEAFKPLGIGPGDIVLNTFLYHLVPAGINLDNGLASIGATVIPSGPGNSDYQAQIAVTLKATGYVGTPSFFKVILDKIVGMGISKQDIPFKKAFFTAEPYPPSLRNLFEGEYGIKTSQSYATADLGFLAYEQSDETGLKISSQLIIEVVDPVSGQLVPPGEVGHVVGTTFNKTYPLIRLGTGDLSAFTDQNCTHLKGWMGRVGDAVKVRGMFLHPLQLTKAIKNISSTGKIQAIIERPETRDNITLKVEFSDQSADQKVVIDRIKTVVSTACRLKIDTVQLVPFDSISTEARTIIDNRTWE